MSEAAVSAIVVTYNRRDLVLRCVAAVLGQSVRVQRLIIVDNGSTDGTIEAVEALCQRPLGPRGPTASGGCFASESMLEAGDGEGVRLLYLAMTSNAGMAGGVEAGLKHALEGTDDDFWIMDDDGYPDQSCLESLLAARGDEGFLCPLVVDEGNHTQLSFTIGGSKSVAAVERMATDGVVPRAANPWNGLLLRRTVVERIGLPVGAMFIWGEEVDYQFRAARHTRVGTAVHARFFHPAERTVYRDSFLGSGIHILDDPFRRYLFFRNRGYILWKHDPWRLIPFVAKYVGYNVFGHRGTLRGGFFMLRALWDGITGRLLSPDAARAVAMSMRSS